jgi:hypothetical protein
MYLTSVFSSKLRCLNDDLRHSCTAKCALPIGQPIGVQELLQHNQRLQSNGNILTIEAARAALIFLRTCQYSGSKMTSCDANQA